MDRKRTNVQMAPTTDSLWLLESVYCVAELHESTRAYPPTIEKETIFHNAATTDHSESRRWHIWTANFTNPEFETSFNIH
jgi:hypothetical protein